MRGVARAVAVSIAAQVSGTGAAPRYRTATTLSWAPNEGTAVAVASAGARLALCGGRRPSLEGLAYRPTSGVLAGTVRSGGHGPTASVGGRGGDGATPLITAPT